MSPVVHLQSLLLATLLLYLAAALTFKDHSIKIVPLDHILHSLMQFLLIPWKKGQAFFPEAQ
jgi:hypothetical protein